MLLRLKKSMRNWCKKTVGKKTVGKKFRRALNMVLKSNCKTVARSLSSKYGRREAGYINGTIENVAQLVSELVSVQAVGAATTQAQLRYLCKNFSFDRLNAQFYNVTLIKQIICAGSKPDVLTFLPLIRTLTTQVSTDIWIVQAIGAVEGNVQKLCDIIDPVAASKIGLLGDLVKKDVCNAAAVASKVAKQGGTTAVTITAPVVTDIAPLSALELFFAPVTTTAA